jgi:hypothetical protein
MTEGLDYQEQLEAIFKRLVEIVRQKSDLDAEATKLTQLLHATANMLPDDERNVIVGKWAALMQAQMHRETTLIDSIRKVLREAGRERLTVAQIRDKLMASGFDFSEYMSNPLASISTTLLRLKEKREVDSKTVEGVATYRLRRRLPGPQAKPPFTLGEVPTRDLPFLFRKN